MTSQASNDYFKKKRMYSLLLELSSSGVDRGCNIWQKLKIFLEKNKSSTVKG